VDTGAITGIVRDASGAVIPDAAVTGQSDSTNLRAALLSNSEGFYAAPALRPGRYRISAASPGFRTKAIRSTLALRCERRGHP
jgi:protocatechuate 3,4-dioxygenase beta subunit